jgi:hypothetical protein
MPAAKVLNGLFGGRLSDFRLRAGAEPLGQAGAELDAVLGARNGQRLCVGIGDHIPHSGQAGRDHVVHGVATRSANTDYGDARPKVGDIWKLSPDIHDNLTRPRCGTRSRRRTEGFS